MIGFGADSNSKKQLKFRVNQNELNKIIKDYKKIKKYMKSSLYDIRMMDGNETVVSKLLESSDQ
jgi:hypothetical protein